MRRLAIPLALAAAACGDAAPQTSSPDADPTSPGDPDAAPTDAAPTDGAPHLIASTPADGARGVSILSSITLTFDAPLDPATVSADSVGVWTSVGQGTTRVQGAITYDAEARAIVFVPRRPLDYASRLSVRIDGVADPDGDLYVGPGIWFRTPTNWMTLFVSYSGGVPYRWTAYQLDAAGQPATAQTYLAPGPDGAWLTSDDWLGETNTYAYDDDGNALVAEILGVGADQLPSTADDVLSSRWTATYGAAGDATRTTLQLPTAAGGPLEIHDAFTYDADGRRRVRISYDAPGSDATWDTADDRADNWSEVSYDADDHISRETTYATGADDLPQTADDFPNGSYVYQTDAHGDYTGYAFTAAGPDGAWLTEDDVITYWFEYQRDEHGLFAEVLEHPGAGPDGTWQTADDPTSRVVTFAYDANRLLVERRTATGRGPDLAWGTADDVLGVVVRNTYAADGAALTQRYFTGAGTDGVWGTADDVLGSRIDY